MIGDGGNSVKGTSRAPDVPVWGAYFLVWSAYFLVWGACFPVETRLAASLSAAERVQTPIYRSAASALPFPSGGGVQMADGDGERIGGISGLRNLVEIQKACHHLLDLMLFGPAVSDHRRLD